MLRALILAAVLTSASAPAPTPKEQCQITCDDQFEGDWFGCEGQTGEVLKLCRAAARSVYRRCLEECQQTHP